MVIYIVIALVYRMFRHLLGQTVLILILFNYYFFYFCLFDLILLINSEMITYCFQLYELDIEMKFDILYRIQVLPFIQTSK